MIETSSPELRFISILVDVLVDAVEQLVQAGQRPRVVRPADHVARPAAAGVNRSAWIARLRCVEEPRMSASAYSG